MARHLFQAWAHSEGLNPLEIFKSIRLSGYALKKRINGLKKGFLSKQMNFMLTKIKPQPNFHHKLKLTF